MATFKQGAIFGGALVIVLTMSLGIIAYSNFLSDDTVDNIGRDVEDVVQMSYVPYKGDLVQVKGGVHDEQMGIVVSKESDGGTFLYNVVEARRYEDTWRECGYNQVGPPQDFGCWGQGYRWDELKLLDRPVWAEAF